MIKELELIDIIPTKEQVEKYAEHINSLSENAENDKISFYKVEDKEATQQRLNEFFDACTENDIEHDVLLSSLIHAKTFEIVNSEENNA